MNPLPWRQDDGGRAAAGFKGDAGDCVVRAIAIAERKLHGEAFPGQRYQEVYDALAELALAYSGKRSARDGVAPAVFRDYLLRHRGWTWTPTMGIGTGCTVHLAVGELPGGVLVARCSKHVAAVVDGVLHDTYDSSRGGTRCVYGYFAPPAC